MDRMFDFIGDFIAWALSPIEYLFDLTSDLPGPYGPIALIGSIFVFAALIIAPFVYLDAKWWERFEARTRKAGASIYSTGSETRLVYNAATKTPLPQTYYFYSAVMPDGTVIENTESTAEYDYPHFVLSRTP